MTRIRPDDFPAGSKEWWSYCPGGGARGVVDSILRLLEQGAISRSKARELLSYDPYFEEPPPNAPWAELNWCGEEPTP